MIINIEEVEYFERIQKPCLAASFSTFAAYFTTWIIRVCHTKRLSVIDTEGLKKHRLLYVLRPKG
ncbi:MAG: hypothetical protein ACP5KD_02945 [Fervidobacterium sp.]